MRETNQSNPLINFGNGDGQVGSSVVVAGADHALRSIHNIKEALAEIWEGDAEEAKQVVLVEQVIQSTAVETAVLA